MTETSITEARSAEGAIRAERTVLATAGLVAGVLGATGIVFGIVLYAIDPKFVGLSVGNAAFGVIAVFFYSITNWRAVLRAAGGRSTAFIALEAAIATGVVGAMIAANYLASQSKIEWDFTRDRLFTLQEQSIKVAKGLKQPVRVVAFFKPSDVVRNQIRELVDLYRRFSDRIELEFINPDAAPPSVVREYQMTATSPRIVIVGENKQMAKIKSPTEEAMTNALVKVADKPPRKVYFVTGHGEPSLEDDKSETGYKRAEIALRDEGYETAALNLIDKEAVPKDASAVVVVAAPKALFPNEVDALKDWLDRGGRLLMLLEPGLELHAEKILEAYGVDVGDNLVVEANPTARAYGFGGDAPLVQHFEDHPITEPLKGEAALFFWVRSVSPRLGSQKARTTTLIQTSASSWGETKYRKAGDASIDEDDYPGPVPIAIAATAEAFGISNRVSDQARLVVFGDSSFPNNKFFTMGGNGDLFTNAVNWLAGDEDKITIRPKMRGASRIPLTETQEYAIMFFSVNLLPLLILGFGFSVWAVRRRK
jgi:gliding motility-associatede transport system auxiliary component